ncbi:MAG: hypothetical protein J1E84_08070, partial [Muribaculaceae bacterium]|nr:hypothetical protein [Muribaculaceae bacterium]
RLPSLRQLSETTSPPPITPRQPGKQVSKPATARRNRLTTTHFYNFYNFYNLHRHTSRRVSLESRFPNLRQRGEAASRLRQPMKLPGGHNAQ